MSDWNSIYIRTTSCYSCAYSVPHVSLYCTGCENWQNPRSVNVTSIPPQDMHYKTFILSVNIPWIFDIQKPLKIVTQVFLCLPNYIQDLHHIYCLIRSHNPESGYIHKSWANQMLKQRTHYKSCITSWSLLLAMFYRTFPGSMIFWVSRLPYLRSSSLRQNGSMP